MSALKIVLATLFIFAVVGCEDDQSPTQPGEELGRLTLLSSVSFPGIASTDVWGYVDADTGEEYVIVGHFPDRIANRENGFSIVDVSDPVNPELLATVNTVPGFDVKVWRHYVYTVNGGRAGRGGIVDIQDPRRPTVVGDFPSAHNIFISPDGYLIAESSTPRLAIYDLNADPTQPALLWGGGVEGHDATVVGNRLYDFHGRSGLNIYDISNPGAPQLRASIQDPTITYYHSGWPSEDQQVVFICDELAIHPTPDVTVWDISDLQNPRRVGAFGDSSATVHNLYVIGDYAYLAYYTAGVRVLDISDPRQPREVAHYDTTPQSGEGFGADFLGAFGVYPFSPSGNIFVSDEAAGLLVFRFQSPE